MIESIRLERFKNFRDATLTLGPLSVSTLAEVGKPNANVRVCMDPLMGGISEATKWAHIREVLDRYRGIKGCAQPGFSIGVAAHNQKNRFCPDHPRKN